MFKGPQEGVGLDERPAAADFGDGGLKVKVDFEEREEVSEGVSVADDFAVDDFYQFEEVEGAVVLVVLEGLVDDKGGGEVAQQLWTGQLQDGEEGFVGRAQVHPLLQLVVPALAERHEQRQQQELFPLRVEPLHRLSVLHRTTLTSFFCFPSNDSSSPSTS